MKSGKKEFTISEDTQCTPDGFEENFHEMPKQPKSTDKVLGLGTMKREMVNQPVLAFLSKEVASF